jgi:hypothetical protein
MSVRITKKRDYRPHAEALHGARVLLDMSASQPKGCYYLWMGSLLLSAFAFEGYVNFLGKVYFPSWKSIGRNLSWRHKTKKIADHVGLLIDEKNRPFETVTLLFRFRNQVAHPKSQELNKEDVKDLKELTTPLEMYEHIKSEEEKFCTEANAKLCLDCVYGMMQLLYDRGKVKYEAENPYRKDSYILYAPFVTSSQSGSYSLG